jgi:8-hydroxy-5-deazaflavin:NADPH oxidoreductase
MGFGVLGTGLVGRVNAGRLAQLGHEVYIGTRDVSKAMSQGEKDARGNPSLKEWLGQNPKVKLVTFKEAAEKGEMVINATRGEHSIEALKMAGEDNLNGKILIDISNPLDFSKSMLPMLVVTG